MTPVTELTDKEFDEILQVIYNRYGYDFSQYARASMERRVNRFMNDSGLQTFFDLKYYLTNDRATFDFFLEKVTVNVTEMFRDPEFYRTLKEKIFPRLSTYPLIRIWHAGCSTGEEVYSTAILLHEAGLLNRTRIYATDINPGNLEKARRGILPLSIMKDYTAGYIKVGGQTEFSNYYTANYNNAIISNEIRENIIFSQHNLVTDQVFNEFQLICCRNVMIYFNKELQDKVVHLFNESLVPFGFLALGLKESLLFTKIRENFEPLDMHLKLFRRVK